ncbi:hypothetical protein [Nocardia sp. XZ_19_385]|uniref:hypothetical protein n=1 Tax=Nocardia sp. XZ_19_385 TaxID=2769488 RepID=UPI00188ECF63|nr:hypothetical protein [Nocardia sp. XZ_19_385]
MTDTTPARSTTAARHGTPTTDPFNPVAVATGGLALGLVLLIVAFAFMDRMPGWADDYGTILVYLAFFLYMSIAGRLTWWSIDTLREQVGARNRR